MAVSLAFLILAGLTYGLVADPPQPTIDDALAQSEAVEAPGFELPVLQQGTLAPLLNGKVSPALADRRVALEELRGRPVVVNSGPRGVSRAERRHRCSSARGVRPTTGEWCSSA